MKKNGLLFLPLMAIIIACSNSARLAHANQSSQSQLLMPDRIESRQEFNPSGSAKCVPKKVNPTLTLTGIASWYGWERHGKETACSTPKKKRVFNMYALTAACKSFPMGSSVRVRNMKNGRTIIVQITDYGPNKKGRLIDLSLGAFEKLGIHRNKGLAMVQVSSL